jgi:hypothetical protein
MRPLECTMVVEYVLLLALLRAGTRISALPTQPSAMDTHNSPKLQCPAYAEFCQWRYQEGDVLE